MGQYTQYKLDVASEHRVMIHSALSMKAYPNPRRNGPDAGGYGTSPFIEDDRFGNVDPGCKWYSHKDDCLQISKAYPDIRFVVRWLGEDDEVWQTEIYLGGTASPCWQDQAIAWLREHEHDESLDGEVTCNCGDFNTAKDTPTIDSICEALAADKEGGENAD